MGMELTETYFLASVIFYLYSVTLGGSTEQFIPLLMILEVSANCQCKILCVSDN